METRGWMIPGGIQGRAQPGLWGLPVGIGVTHGGRNIAGFPWEALLDDRQLGK